MNDVERALECFNKNYNCSQSILSTYAPRFGVSREESLKIASAFGGGIVRMGNICGAVTGAFMTIGLRYGIIVDGEKESPNDKSYEVAREFIDKFTSVNDTIICKDLLGCDINTPEGKQYAEDNNLIESVCMKAVKTSAEILEKFL